MKKIALLFPGGGSQYVGMGKALYNEYSSVKKIFEEASDAINLDMAKLCFEGNMDELSKIENTLPAVATVSYAAFKIYMNEIGIEPEYLAGHSLGEYSALACSGAISFPDMIRITRKRGEFIKEASEINPGISMAVDDLDIETIRKVLKSISTKENHVGIGCFNATNQMVISGHPSAVDKAGEGLLQVGGKITQLKVDLAVHSILLELAGQKLENELAKYTFNDPRWPVISNVTARPHENKDSITNNLIIQMTEPVNWSPTMKYLKDKGINVAIELGPKAALRGLVRKNVKYVNAFSFDNKEDRRELSRLLITKDRGYIPPFASKCLAVAITTKNNNFNEEEYAEGVLRPCSEIRKIQLQTEAGNGKLTLEKMREILDKLKLIFKTKGVPVDEQNERIAEIIIDTHTQDLFDVKDLKLENNQAIDFQVHTIN